METGAMRVLNYIKEHGSITRADAFTKIGVANLTAAIDILRNHQGIPIITVIDEKIGMYGTKVRYARYVLGVQDENAK